mgnify:CR=1 FL=1
MSNRNIAIAGAAIIAIAGIAYTQQSDDTETVAIEAATETTEVTTSENAQETETAPAANTADNANEINTTENTSEATIETSATNEAE